jgi:hypothetical protein
MGPGNSCMGIKNAKVEVRLCRVLLMQRDVQQAFITNQSLQRAENNAKCVNGDIRDDACIGSS